MRVVLLVLAVVCPTIYGFPEHNPVEEFEPIVGGLSGTGFTTRYWDCCKPACSWQTNVSNKTKIAPVRSCAKDGVHSVDIETTNACDRQKPKNDAFACNDQQPWVVSKTLAYGFAAFSVKGGEEVAKCCTCIKLDFQGQLKGKTLIAQVINTGIYEDKNHFDINIPGGGVGINNACDLQWNAPKDGWGDRYGGIHTREECDTVLPKPLRKGCYFRFDFLESVPNPDVIFQEVKCPKAITDVTGCVV